MDHSGVYFDIGANLGKWSNANLNKFFPAKIVAVEASPVIFPSLKHNTKGHHEIVCEQYAVSASVTESEPGPGSITFYRCLNEHTLSTLNLDWLTSEESRFAGSKYEAIQVPVITIDSLIEKHGVPTLIKVDVEGAEDICLKSLNQKVKTVCFEWASETLNVAFNAMEHLKSLGFNLFYIQDGDEYTFRPSPLQGM